jgi:hypothetical protein
MRERGVMAMRPCPVAAPARIERPEGEGGAA